MITLSDDVAEAAAQLAVARRAIEKEAARVCAAHRAGASLTLGELEALLIAAGIAGEAFRLAVVRADEPC